MTGYDKLLEGVVLNTFDIYIKNRDRHLFSLRPESCKHCGAHYAPGCEKGIGDSGFGRDVFDSKDRSHAGILHADVYGKSAALRNIEPEYFTCKITKNKAEHIQGYYSDEYDTGDLAQSILVQRNYQAADKSDEKGRERRKYRFNSFGKVMKFMLEPEAQKKRQDHHEHYALDHRP